MVDNGDCDGDGFQISPSRYGKCEDRTLSLDQELCVVEQHIKTPAPAPARYGGYSHGQPGHSAAPFTAFI